MKKFFSILMILVMAITVVPQYEAYAANDEMAKDLETVLTIVKGKADIPDEYPIFEYYYYDDYYYGDPGYYFTWRTEDYENMINLAADGAGRILRYGLYTAEEERSSVKYRKSELEKKAEEYIKKLSPELAGKYKLSGSQKYGGEGFLYTFGRFENGYFMPANSITVVVSNSTGEIISYDADWYFDAKLPSPDHEVTKKQAAAKLKDAVNMELRYLSYYDYDEPAENRRAKTFLAYFPDKRGLYVDAKTGEVLLPGNNSAGYGTNGVVEEAAKETDDAGSGSRNVLTEAELTEINNIKGLISKEEAIDLIKNNKSLAFDSKMTQITPRLMSSTDKVTKEKTYNWNIYFSDPEEPDYENNDWYRVNASASVNAKTGKIESYYISSNYEVSSAEYKKANIKYDETQCCKVFEDFAKAEQSDLFKDTVYTDCYDSLYIYDTGSKKAQNSKYIGKRLNYSRVNEGIRYDANGFYGTVNAVTGKITEFGFTWDKNAEFDSPVNIISADDAFSKYISFDGFNLEYKLIGKEAKKNGKYFTEYEVILAYTTDAIYPYYISAFNGKQLSSDGKEFVKKTDGYSYSDVKGTKYEQDIMYLADLGAGFEGGKFEPEKAVTKDEFVALISDALGYRPYGYLDDISGSGTISRRLMAKYLVNASRYEDAAKLQGIYKTKFKDNGKIGAKYLGYVAIATATGIMEGRTKNYFKPKANVTRGEAAHYAVLLITGGIAR